MGVLRSAVMTVGVVAWIRTEPRGGMRRPRDPARLHQSVGVHLSDSWLAYK